jgi:hypothetical protein
METAAGSASMVRTGTRVSDYPVASLKVTLSGVMLDVLLDATAL